MFEHMIYGSTDEHEMYSARYHQHQEGSGPESQTIIFPGHMDKAFVRSVIFLPLTSRDFFTIVAVPKSWSVNQDKESYAQLQDWIRGLPTDEKEMVDDFLQKFVLIAENFMKNQVKMRVFACKAGSLLAFPANKCFHTTITPGDSSKSKNPRDLFIIHTTASTKR